MAQIQRKSHFNKIYCGIEDTPQNKQRGTAKECLKKNQVRYWGVRKIDEHTLKKIKEYKESIKQESKAGLKMVTLTAEIKNLKMKLTDDTLSDKRKERIKESIRNKIKLFKQQKELYKKLKNKNQSM